MKLKMNDGFEIPMLGLGCFKSEDTAMAVETALSVGYRHIDTANFYENETYVGKGIRSSIRNSVVKRKDVFVVSKIWPTSFQNPERAIEYSLKSLNIDYIDAYLLHWPGLDKDARYKAWECLLKYRDKGYFKSIGVSNFKKEHLEDLIEKFGIIPSLNEIEISPWLQKREDYACCKEKGIVMSASVPFAKGNILSDEKLIEIGKKYGKDVGQVILRWNLQRGNCVIPKSSKPHRIKSNFNVFDFELSKEDIDIINSMENGNTYCSDSSVFDGAFWNIEDNLINKK